MPPIRPVLALAGTLMVMLVAPAASSAATVTWTGNGDGTRWFDDNNWSTGATPYQDDDVVIDGDYTDDGPVIIDDPGGDPIALARTVMITGSTVDDGITLTGGMLVLSGTGAVDLTMSGTAQLTISAGSHIMSDVSVNPLRFASVGPCVGCQINLDALDPFYDGGAVQVRIDGLTIVQVSDIELPAGLSQLVVGSTADRAGIWSADERSIMGSDPGAVVRFEGSPEHRAELRLLRDSPTGALMLEFGGSFQFVDADVRVRHNVSMVVAGSVTGSGSRFLYVPLDGSQPAFPFERTVFTAASVQAGAFVQAAPGSAYDAPWGMNAWSGPTTVGFRLVESEAPTKPVVGSTSHTGSVASTIRIVTLALSGASDAHSGIAGYAITWDHDLNGSAGSTITLAATGNATATSPQLADGTWFAHVATVDASGNVSDVVHAGPFMIVSPAVPPKSDPVVSKPPTGSDPTLPTDSGPTPPVLPSPGKVTFVGKAPRFGALGRTGSFSVRLPVTEAIVRSTMVVRVNRSQARMLGLRMPKGAKSMLVGTGSATSKKPGQLVVRIKLTRAAKVAFTRLAASKSKRRQASMSLELTLTKSTLRSTLRKVITVRR